MLAQFVKNAPFPEITETKSTLAGSKETFLCRLIERTSDHAVVLFISSAPTVVGGIMLPTGTITFGYFWPNRPYNVYHWLSPAGITIGHYFNLADSTRIEPGHIDWRDLVVDVLVLPGRAPEILDMNELPADLALDLKKFIAQGTNKITAGAGALVSEIESATRALWPRTFNEHLP